MDIAKLNSAFDSYVNEYDMNDNNILYKYNHTYRVCKNSKNVCKSLNLNEEQSNLAYLIALLHDIGRFYQDKMYKTFFEKADFDHGDYGVKLLFEDGLIRKFIDNTDNDKLIYLAVKNHNKYSVENNLKEEEKLYCNIVRDADKLDIIDNFIEIIKINNKEEDDSEITEKVKEEFLSHRMVNKNYRKTNSDVIVTIISQIYDLKFDYSFKFIKENNYIEKIYQTLKNKEKFKLYFEEANKYIDERCNDVRN